MDGFIRLNRKFFTNVYWSQQRTFSLSEAWLDLIQMARFDAEPATKELPNGRLITIKRGEIHAGLSKRRSDTSISILKNTKSNAEPNTEKVL